VSNICLLAIFLFMIPADLTAKALVIVVGVAVFLFNSARDVLGYIETMRRQA
jgi:hypothetical protein